MESMNCKAKCYHYKTEIHALFDCKALMQVKKFWFPQKQNNKNNKTKKHVPDIKIENNIHWITCDQMALTQCTIEKWLRTYMYREPKQLIHNENIIFIIL